MNRPEAKKEHQGLKALLGLGDTWSLRARLIGLASLWFILSLVVVSVFLTSFFSFAANRQFQSGIDVLQTHLYANIFFDEDNRLIPPPNYDPRLNNAYTGLYWQITEIDANDKPLWTLRSRSLLNANLSVPERMNRSGDSVYYDSTDPLGRPLRVSYKFISYKRHNLIYVVAEDKSKIGQDVTTFAIITGTALLLMSAFSLLAIFYQVRIGLRPLDQLGDEISALQRSEKQRLDGVYPSEIKPIAQQLNAFLDHNQDVLERQRTHVGNLAHALKTPISVLLGTATDETPLSQIVKKQVDLMHQHVDRHLRRARAAARSQTIAERTEIEPVIDELAVMLEQVFHLKGVIIDWRCDEGLYFQGERQDLQEMLGNLIENACIWARSKVTVKATGTEDYAVILVSDDGPGLDPSRYDDVLKRGARLDESAPGSGLGLSIVDELVRSYKGRLVLGRAKLGGLEAGLHLPTLLRHSGEEKLTENN